MLPAGASLMTSHGRPVRLYVPCTQSPSYMPSRTASRSRHLAPLHHETPPAMGTARLQKDVKTEPGTMRDLQIVLVERGHCVQGTWPTAVMGASPCTSSRASTSALDIKL